MSITKEHINARINLTNRIFIKEMSDKHSYERNESEALRMILDGAEALFRHGIDICDSGTINNLTRKKRDIIG